MEIPEILKFADLGVTASIAVFLVVNYAKQNNFFVSQMKEIIFAIKSLQSSIGKTILNKQQTTKIFTLTLFEHIEKKIAYARESLEKNDIHAREKEIKRNLRNKFESITKEETDFLSTFNTPAGDLGYILSYSIDWEKFMLDIYEIFFREIEGSNDKTKTIQTKCHDIRELMRGYVNNILEIIEEKMRKNIMTM
jgi:hypothetical protein